MKQLDDKQQTTIMWCVGGAIAAAAVYFALLRPLYFSPRAELVKGIAAEQKAMQDNASLKSRADAANKKWKQLRMSSDENVMESELSQIVADASSRNAGSFTFTHTVNGASKPLVVPRTKERPDIHTDFVEIHYQASGTTTTSHVGRFLQYLEKYVVDTKTPARIDQIKINSKKSGTDELQLDVQFSAIVYKPRAGGTALDVAEGSATGPFDPGFGKPLDPPLPPGADLADQLKKRRLLQLAAPEATTNPK